MISVIMPVYNGQDYIALAIESILNQTFTDFELIIIDDGSTDNTRQIYEAFAAKDQRICIILGDHAGVSAALNLGLQAARYPWVAIMHADDVAQPQRLAIQWEMAQTDPEVVIWGTDGFHISVQGEIMSRFRVGPTSKHECFAQRADGRLVQAIHPTVMLNRDVALRVGGYNPRFQVCEDIDLFDRMMTHGALVTIPYELLNYRVHGKSLSMTKYLSQGIIARYIGARQKHRLQTGEELSYDDFLAAYHKRPGLARLRDRMNDLTGMYYRRAGMAFSNKQYVQLFFYFMLSAMLNPMYALPRLWVQVLSPLTRRSLHTSTHTLTNP